MGEVGTNSADSPHADLKMNGGINGNCDDEAMDVDAQNTSNQSIAKDVETTDQPSTTNNSSDVIEVDTSGNSDSIELDKNDTTNKTLGNDCNEAEAQENGAEHTKEYDQKSIEETNSVNSAEKIDSENESDTNKIVEDNDSMVKVSSDPLSADAEPMDDDDDEHDQNDDDKDEDKEEDSESGDKRSIHSRPQSTENGTSARVTSSNDKKGQLTSKQMINKTIQNTN